MVKSGAFAHAQQEDMSAELLNMLPFPLLLIDNDDRFVWLNPAAESFFQSSTAYLAGRALTEMLPADSPFFALLHRVRQAGRPVVEKAMGLVSPWGQTGAIQMVPILAAGQPEAEHNIGSLNSPAEQLWNRFERGAVDGENDRASGS